MNTRKDVGRKEKTVANPSKRSRLDSLLFEGAKLGTTLVSAAFTDPKFPVLAGD